jgi:outer membrane receptor protein involved in Fe transport
VPGALIALWLLAGQPAPVASPPPQFAEEVVVTAERGPEPRAETPAAVSVLTREEIARLPAENLAELLDEMPGFQVVFAEGFGLAPVVSSRGFFGGGEVEYVQLLVDGVPVADAESGLADWRRIRAADVERVEALRGPASAAYGDTALAGVVQVFRRSGAPRTDLALSGASFGTWAADAAYRGGGDALGLSVAGTASRTHGFRDHSRSDETGADVWLGGGGLARPWSLTVSGTSRDREDPGYLTREQLDRDRFGSDPLSRFDREHVRRGRAALSYQRRDGALPFRAVLHGALRDGRSLRTLLLAPGFSDRADRDLTTRSLGVSLEAEKALGASGRDSRLRAGVELSRDWLDTSYRPVGGDGTRGPRAAEASGHRRRVGAFVSGDWHASSRLRLAAGLRWDAITDDGGTAAPSLSDSTAWSPRAGATLQLGTAGGAPVSLFAQVSRAFKAATLDQLLDPRPFPDFQGGSFRISNPLLSPQRASTLEAGLAQARPSGRWELVAYRTSVEDEIDFDPATFRYLNIGRSRHYGFEASARLFDGRSLSPHAAYAWTRVQATEGGRRGWQLKNIPEHLLRAGLTARLPGGLGADVRLTWTGGRWVDDANEIPFRDGRVVDLRLARMFGRARLRLDALNVTGHEWEPLGYVLDDFAGGQVAYYLPAPDRAIRIGVEWAF